MRSVVVGGSGFVGRSVVARLVSRGHDVALLSRNPRVATSDVADGARVVPWSLEPGPVRDAWSEEIARADAVVNLAGAGVMDRAWTDARRRELVSSRVDVTQAIVAALDSGDRGRPRCLVSASAVGYYGVYTGERVLAEECPPAGDFLAVLCRDWEHAAFAAEASGVRVVCTRLGIVLGASGGALAEMLAPFRLHAGGPIGTGAQWVSWVHERDAASAIVHAVDTSSLRGPCNVVAPTPVTMGELAAAIAAAMGTHARLRVPAALLRLVLGEGRAAVVLGGQRASPARLLASGFTFSFETIDAALRDLLARP